MTSMRENTRIYFLMTNVARPVGGHHVIIRHIKDLRRSGFNAFGVFPIDGHSIYRPMLDPEWVLSPEVAFEDKRGIFVMPESDGPVWAEQINDVVDMQKGAKSVVLNQNHYYTFRWDDRGATERLFHRSCHVCTSEVIADFLRRFVKVTNLHIVKVGVDANLFVPRKKLFQIAMMSRKMKEEAAFYERAFRYYAPEYSGVAIVDIAELPQTQVAEVLGRSSVFLCLQKNEGLGLPALEAMACGCVVVGYDGGGGGCYATNSNGFWLESGDALSLLERLKYACDIVSSRSEVYSDIVAAARRTAREFNLERERTQLVETWYQIQDGGFQ